MSWLLSLFFFVTPLAQAGECAGKLEVEVVPKGTRLTRLDRSWALHIIQEFLKTPQHVPTLEEWTSIFSALLYLFSHGRLEDIDTLYELYDHVINGPWNMRRAVLIVIAGITTRHWEKSGK